MNYYCSCANMKMFILLVFAAFLHVEEGHQHFGLSERLKLIFPGTKWCGDGSAAQNLSDLGMLSDTDKCCRSHDLCDDYIQSKHTSHGLINNGPFTLLNCKCDEEFYQCLKSNEGNIADKTVSPLIGTLFFNAAPIFDREECFREEYPVIRCKRRHFILKRCLEYEYDTTKPKKYQWFDRPVY